MYKEPMPNRHDDDNDGDNDGGGGGCDDEWEECTSRKYLVQMGNEQDLRQNKVQEHQHFYPVHHSNTEEDVRWTRLTYVFLNRTIINRSTRQSP